MFEGVSKGKLIGWMLFFAFMTFACFSVDTAMTRIIAFIFLMVVVVLFFGVKNKLSRNATYRRLNRQLAESQVALDEPETSSESSYFGPPPSLEN